MSASKSHHAQSIGWAFYLGASWTWCIGMFLPVLLMRDQGRFAWLVFAIPNVVGAASVGWVLTKAKAVAHRDRHAVVCLIFSAVTILFHVAFARILASVLGEPWLWSLLTVVAIPIAWGAVRGASIVVTVASAALVLSNLQPAAYPEISQSATWLSVVSLGPCLLFGFFLCPYLDLTFLRARACLDDAHGRRAFGLGFGVVFLAMAALTFLYAGPVLRLLGEGEIHAASLRPFLRAVGIHMVLQAGLTVGLHIRESIRLLHERGWGGVPDSKLLRDIGWTAALGAVAMLVLQSAPLAERFGLTFGAASGAEAVYWGFMGFYGTAAPAYVWIFAVCLRHRRFTTLPWVLWAISCACSFPMLWAGFVWGETLWIWPAMVWPLLAGIVARGTSLPAADRS